MSIHETLLAHQEPCPEWLLEVTPERKPSVRDFLDSRIVFYPGSGQDGQAIKEFGSARAAHCFVYADYMMPRDSVIESLDRGALGPQGGPGVRGYRSLARFDLTKSDFPVRWKPGVSRFTPRERPWSYETTIRPYAFLQILERLPDFEPQWGADRLALLMLGADAFAAFEALFCLPDAARQLYGVLLQDHGFGGNYYSFGREGLMERMAQHYGVLPPWLLVGDGNQAWDGYDVVPNAAPEMGSGRRRRLYAYQMTPSSRTTNRAMRARVAPT